MHNPYKLETEITIDGKELAQNSKLGEETANGLRLQEWVEKLPKVLIEEYNDTEFEVTFHGTTLDFEDLRDVFLLAYKTGEITAVPKFDHKKAKETFDKEGLIEEVFNEILNGDIEALKGDDVQNAFKAVKNSDFEVCVVATMSAGKSTLINAMLGAKLMPSKQEACTAIITRIKDNDSEGWKAKVKYKDGQATKEELDITYNKMKGWNADENVSEIIVEGNIPFVKTEETSLILIDTPGPDNARVPEHKQVQEEYLDKSPKSLMICVLEPTFGNQSSFDLLEDIAENMKVDDKLSRDRFLFVINKLDGRRIDDDSTIQDTLDKVRNDLKDRFGIINPKLFPAIALSALDIRLVTKCGEVDMDTKREARNEMERLNERIDLHLETYSPLPASLRSGINDLLTKAEETQDVYFQALIHTGIPSIEAEIKQYVQKYAKVAKIRNLVEVFKHKVEAEKCVTRLKGKIASNQEERERILNEIKVIYQKIEDGNSAQTFKEAVEDAIRDVNEKSREIVENIVGDFSHKLHLKIDRSKGREISVDKADEEIRELEDFAKELEPKFHTKLKKMIKDNLYETGKALLSEYKKRLNSLASEIQLKDDSIPFDVIELMGGDVVYEFSVNDYIRTKKVEDGDEWVKNTDKKWYKPWTWFQESGYYRTKYKEEKYIDGGELAYEYLSLIERSIVANGISARAQAVNQSQNIAESFKVKFEELDDKLKSILKELERCAKTKDKVEELIYKAEIDLKWLESISKKVESILEI